MQQLRGNKHLHLTWTTPQLLMETPLFEHSLCNSHSGDAETGALCNDCSVIKWEHQSYYFCNTESKCVVTTLDLRTTYKMAS